MGWTHYWERPPVLPTEALKKAVIDCQKVLASAGVALAGEAGKGLPVFNDYEITFNGADGRYCEPFQIKTFETPRRPGRQIVSYCKTEKLPYDLCVKCALIVFSHYMGNDFKVASDGKDDDWQDAKQLCQSCLGYGSDFTLSDVS
jgi:hypothetical protein